MLKDGGKLGSTTEFTVLRDDLRCTCVSFSFFGVESVLSFFQLLLMIIILILLLW